MSGLRRVAVVGASLAGTRVMRALRRKGFDGELVLIGEEDELLPYDRPPLSKSFLTAPEPVPARLLEQEDFYDGVELHLGVRAARLLPSEQSIELTDGQLVAADAVVVATGASARKLPAARGLDGVLTLRTIADARALRDVLRGSDEVVVLGAGFIGCEVAASARTVGAHVTLVEPLATPVVRGVGAGVGAAIADLHVSNGVELRMNARVDAIDSQAGHVRSVTLSTGERLAAECVVVGIGSTPRTEWLAGSGLTVNDGVLCDARGRAIGAERVWAAGDVAAWHRPRHGEPRRHEHWTGAVDQAAIVAADMLGESAVETDESVPYVWSDQFGSKIQILGETGADAALTMLYGTALTDRSFAAAYSRGGRLCGAVAVNLPRAVVELRPLIAASAPLADAG